MADLFDNILSAEKEAFDIGAALAVMDIDACADAYNSGLDTG